MRPTWTLAARHALAVLLVLAAAAPVRAQFFTPPPASLLIDTSNRTAAMGGASGAVLWGEPGVWANPATLSGVRGVGWVTGHTHVLPGVEDDVVFGSQRLLIGGGGLGFSLMGQPISGLGKARLEYPSALPPFNASGDKVYDLSEGWAVGVSPLRLVQDVRRVAKMNAGSLTSYGDVTFGYAGKKSRAEGAGPVFSFDEASTYDWGVAGRLALARWWGADAPFRLDLSGAYSHLNQLESDSEASGASTVQIDRTAVALHLSPAPPSQRAASPPSLPWWRPGDIPALSVGLAYDHDAQHPEPFAGERSSVDHYGLEANVFRLVAFRAGYVNDPDGEIAGWSYGGGLSLPIGPWGSVGYQLASVPMPDGVDRQFRQGWSLWMDPTRFWSDER
jgi:hypothetical protein